MDRLGRFIVSMNEIDTSVFPNRYALCIFETITSVLLSKQLDCQYKYHRVYASASMSYNSSSFHHADINSDIFSKCANIV